MNLRFVSRSDIPIAEVVNRRKLAVIPAATATYNVTDNTTTTENIAQTDFCYATLENISGKMKYCVILPIAAGISAATNFIVLVIFVICCYRKQIVNNLIQLAITEV